MRLFQEFLTSIKLSCFILYALKTFTLASSAPFPSVRVAEGLPPLGYWESLGLGSRQLHCD